LTKVVLVDARLEMIELTAGLLRTKARRIKLAMLLLTAAVVLVGIGIPLH